MTARRRPEDYSDRPTHEWGGSALIVFWAMICIAVFSLVAGLALAYLDSRGDGLWLLAVAGGVGVGVTYLIRHAFHR